MRKLTDGEREILIDLERDARAAGCPECGRDASGGGCPACEAPLTPEELDELARAERDHAAGVDLYPWSDVYPEGDDTIPW
jgi:hypothetical protein